ncbi:MAG TPA: O-antigen ligase family protein, partial [Candidatus Eisenbacteria bacterium]|nr:O-antigen ligase family protein [Candidatus Eisenbacteria bacterium]
IHHAIGALFAGGAAVRVRRGFAGFTEAIRRDPLAAAMAACFAASALATLLSDRPIVSLFGEPSRPAGLLVAAAMTILFAASRAASRSPGWFDRVAIVSSSSAGAAALYALAQWAGLDPISWEGAATIDGRMRVPSTLGHPNLLGAYLAMTLPLSAYLAWRTRALPGRAAWAAVACASIIVLAITLSRGAWLAAAAAAATAGFLLLLSRRTTGGGSRISAPALIAALIAALLAALLFAIPLWTPFGEGFRTRLAQIADLRAPTSQSRLLLWEAGARMTAEHPIAGVGTDAFGAHFPRYRTPAFWEVEWGGAPVKAHSEFVQIAATQGAIGLAAALAAVLFAAGALLRLARRRTEDEGGAGAAEAGLSAARTAAAGALLAAWAVSSATNFSVAATGSLAAVMSGWIAGRTRAPVPETPVRAEPPRIDALRAAVAVLAATLLWVPLVATPWRAEFAASRARILPIDDPERAALLRRASLLAPWQDRYPAELGRTHLVLAFAARSPRDAWRHLGWSRGAYERAVSAGPGIAEHRAFLARVMAAQSGLTRSPSAARLAASALSEAYAADSTSANVLVLLAEGYAALGSAPDAHRLATRCARLYPDYAVPMADLGILALDAGRAVDAADTLSLALRRSWRDTPGTERAAREALARAIEVREAASGR